MTTNDVEIGNQIKWLREARSKSANELASSSGLATADYVNGEVGNRRFSARELVAIAKALQIGLGDILVVLQDKSGVAVYRNYVRKRLA